MFDWLFSQSGKCPLVGAQIKNMNYVLMYNVLNVGNDRGSLMDLADGSKDHSQLSTEDNSENMENIEAKIKVKVLDDLKTMFPDIFRGFLSQFC